MKRFLKIYIALSAASFAGGAAFTFWQMSNGS